MTVLCGTLMSGLYLLTRDQIEHNQRAFAMTVLKEVSGNPSAKLERTGDDQYQILDDSGGQIYTVSTNEGYNGTIILWMALDKQGHIRGIRVREHRETPGIGDIVDHRVSSWIDQFIGSSAASPTPQDWQLDVDGGQFDHVTGATITSRAVTRAIHRGLVQEQRQGVTTGNDDNE